MPWLVPPGPRLVAAGTQRDCSERTVRVETPNGTIAMRRFFKRLLLVLLGAVVLLASAGAIVLSHDSACGEPPAAPREGPTMRAIVHRCYGGPEVLRLETLPRPVPKADEVLVRVHAAAANPLDWHYLRGSPYIMRLSSGLGTPRSARLGVDFAGVVESVGSGVTRFKAGDRVFGGRTGVFADYVVVRESRAIVHVPDGVSLEQAAAVPVSALTALQGLRDHGLVARGQRVLVNGASGGVGTFAVQIAKSLGAEVTAVCSTRNVELVRSLGADHVVDYTREDFTTSGERYDVILDMVGNHGLLALRRALVPGGRVVIVGGPPGDWIGPLGAPLRAMLLGPFVDETMKMFMAELPAKDLETLRELLASGTVRSVIDRRFSLEEAAEAIRYLETGRARGKVIVTIVDPPG